MRLRLLSLACWLMLLPSAGAAQAPRGSSAAVEGAQLRYVVYLSRHGVRSPTGKAAQYNRYSAGPWPAWPVQPGYLTSHGFHLMELFGAFDRVQMAEQGLFAANGCADASRVTIYADSDQRTRETGKAIAQGLMPGCNLPVDSLPEGTNDPLFHSINDASTGHDPALAAAAIAGRLGGDPANLTRAYYPQIAALDHILATCGAAPSSPADRVSLFDIPATLSGGSGDRSADLKGPIDTAATLSENLLLEYAEGMDSASVGWGCVHHDEIQAMMALHTAATDFTERTPQIARAQASHLLDRIRLSMRQAVDQKAMQGAMGKPSDRALFLIGHDTNLENVAGVLNLTWIIDGRRDDTPPGSALIFEVWRKRSNRQYLVRTYFTAQTLEQMRAATPLTVSSPPERIPVFIPGCSDADMSCSLGSFLHLLEEDSDQRTIAHSGSR